MELIAFLLGGVFVLAGGYFAVNRTVLRLSALQRDRDEGEAAARLRAAVADVLGEMRDNMALAQGEFRSGMTTDPLVPAGFVTHAWEMHRGTLLSLGENGYEVLRSAYGAAYYANSVRDYVLSASTRSFGKSSVADYIEVHREVLKQKAIPELYKAIDMLETRA